LAAHQLKIKRNEFEQNIWSAESINKQPHIQVFANKEIKNTTAN
jgi:hypothetical protein